LKRTTPKQDLEQEYEEYAINTTRFIPNGKKNEETINLTIKKMKKLN